MMKTTDELRQDTNAVLWMFEAVFLECADIKNRYILCYRRGANICMEAIL